MVMLFGQRGLDFLLVSGHFTAPFEANHLYLPGAEAQGGAGDIHRHIAAADHQDPVFHRRLPGRSRVPEEFDPMKHAIDLFAFDAELAAFLGPGGEENGLVILPERLEGDVFAEAAVIDELDALAADQFDFMVQNVLWQPVLGNPPAEHAAGGAEALQTR